MYISSLLARRGYAIIVNPRAVSRRPEHPIITVFLKWPCAFVSSSSSRNPERSPGVHWQQMLLLTQDMDVLARVMAQ